MARKKKKVSRKEQVQQRRAAAEQVRQERGWQPRARPQGQAGGQELLDDMLPLFPMAKDGPPSPAIMDEFLLTLLDSAGLAEEPELKEILVHPLLAASTLAEAGEELGLNPDTLDELPAEEQADRRLDLLELTTERLLTDELRQEIGEALEQLRQRLKRSGDQQKVPQVAALQTFLSDNQENNKLLSSIGLIQAIVERSVAAGFELFESSAEAIEEELIEAGDTATTVRQKLAKSSAAQKAEEIVRKVPGLSGFFQKQADRTWEEGMDALFQGDLVLGLFTQEELEAGIEIFAATVGEARESGSTPPGSPETGMVDFVTRLKEYLASLMTPARFAEARAHLNDLMRDKSYNSWLPFLLMLDNALAEDAQEGNSELLVGIFIGELRAGEPDDEEDRDPETEEEL